MCLLALLLDATNANAQNAVSDPCAALIQESLKLAHDNCDSIGNGKACYGHASITAGLASGSNATFAKSGDSIPLDTVNTLQTSPINVDKKEWGIAVLKLGDSSKIESTATE